MFLQLYFPICLLWSSNSMMNPRHMNRAPIASTIWINNLLIASVAFCGILGGGIHKPRWSICHFEPGSISYTLSLLSLPLFLFESPHFKHNQRESTQLNGRLRSGYNVQQDFTKDLRPIEVHYHTGKF